jgi:hypothetical protein
MIYIGYVTVPYIRNRHRNLIVKHLGNYYLKRKGDYKVLVRQILREVKLV